MRFFRNYLVLCCCLCSSIAGAGEGEDEGEDDNEDDGKIEWSGRLFVGDTLTRQRIAGETFWRNRQAVNSARVTLAYKHSDDLKAVIKLEFEDGDPELRDAYIRLSPVKGLRLQAGRFKRQISAIGLASRWELPIIERGLLNSLEVEEQELPFVGGRGTGVMVRYKIPIVTKPTLTASMYQNRLGKGQVSLDASEHFAQDVYLRASFEPIEDLDVASTMAFIGYLSTTGEPESFKHAPVVSLEATYVSKFVRIWLEGFTGRSLFAQVDGSTGGRFVAARGLVAPRLRPGTPRRLEPYIGASYFDPRHAENQDSNTEILGGVNFAFSKVWRLQLELSYLTNEGSASSAAEGAAFRLQLGARFKD